MSMTTTQRNALVQKYRKVTTQIEVLKQEQDSYKEQLIDLLREENTDKMTFPGVGATIQIQTITQSRFDSKTFGTENPDLYNSYKKSITYEKFKVS